MPQTKYQVTLAIDGKHAVSVQSDDPAAVTEGLVWAQDTYKKLMKMGHGAAGKTTPAVENSENRADLAPEESRVDADTGAPICLVHDVPMTWVDKNGGFWSCHEKTEDGSWCKYRPPKAA